MSLNVICQVFFSCV